MRTHRTSPALRDTPIDRPRRAAGCLALAFLLGSAATPGAASAQISEAEAAEFHGLATAAEALPGGAAPEAFPAGPFGNAARFIGPGASWYASIPHSVALNPTGGFTFEGWVQVITPGNCPTIAGKGFLTAWWVGICTNTLRSYLRGSGTAFTIGTLTTGVWHHIAVTWDGDKLRHYVDGDLAGERTQTEPPTTNTKTVRIGRDEDWSSVPDARYDELRLWNRALNAAEVNQFKRYAIRDPQDGLVAVWSFDDISSSAAFLRDEVGPHDGSLVNGPLVYHDSGQPVVVAPEPPDTAWLTTGELPGFEFQVRITSGGTERLGTKVADCVPETLCVAGAIPTRSEIFLRIIGPRPNGFLWAQSARFTVSQVEVWIRESATGQINYYDLAPVDADSDENFGFNDRNAFLP